jgi:hypothetical protein
MNKEKYSVQITKAAWLDFLYFVIRGAVLSLVVGGVLYAIFYGGIIPRIV